VVVSLRLAPSLAPCLDEGHGRTQPERTARCETGQWQTDGGEASALPGGSANRRRVWTRTNSAGPAGLRAGFASSLSAASTLVDADMSVDSRSAVAGRSPVQHVRSTGRVKQEDRARVLSGGM
jgi:hypothetical protein